MTCLDRLARSTADLLAIAERIKEADAGLIGESRTVGYAARSSRRRVWGAIAASLIEGEVITTVGYVGGTLIFLASILNVLTEATADHKKVSDESGKAIPNVVSG